METINTPVLFVLGLLVVFLLVWAIYRNFKDEKKFENEMDDTHRHIDHHHSNNKT